MQKYYGQYAENQGKRFVIMYGLSEATAAITWLPAEDILRKPGSVGIVIPEGGVSLIDEEGYYMITGRRKRYLKMSGHRISLDEIDNMIMDELGVFSVSIGTDDHMVIFVTDEKEVEMVRSFIRENLLLSSSDVRVLAIPEFPQNEGGKILYAELQAMVFHI